jgi:hypothetical protein
MLAFNFAKRRSVDLSNPTVTRSANRASGHSSGERGEVLPLAPALISCGAARDGAAPQLPLPALDGWPVLGTILADTNALWRATSPDRRR